MKVSLAVLLFLQDSSAMKLLNDHQNHSNFITDDLKSMVSKGPELGALQNKLKKLETIAPRIAEARTDIIELLKPLPKPKPIIHVVTCNPPLVVLNCEQKPPPEIVIEHEVEPPVVEKSVPVVEKEIPVVEIEDEKPKKKKKEKEEENQCDCGQQESCDCNQQPVSHAHQESQHEEEEEHESKPAEEEDTSGPVLNVNTKIKKALDKALALSSKVKNKTAQQKVEEQMSISDLTDKALSIPSSRKDPDQAKSSLKDKIEKAAEQEVSKQGLVKEKSVQGEPKVTNVDVEKIVKENMEKKEEESKDDEKVPDQKAKQKDQEDKNLEKAAAPVAKEFPKTPRRQTQGTNCPNCYDDDVVLESGKRLRENANPAVKDRNDEIDQLDNDTRQKNGYACSNTSNKKKCSQQIKDRIKDEMNAHGYQPHDRVQQHADAYMKQEQKAQKYLEGLKERHKREKEISVFNEKSMIKDKTLDDAFEKEKRAIQKENREDEGNEEKILKKQMKREEGYNKKAADEMNEDNDHEKVKEAQKKIKQDVKDKVEAKMKSIDNEDDKIAIAEAVAKKQLIDQEEKLETVTKVGKESKNEDETKELPVKETKKELKEEISEKIDSQVKKIRLGVSLAVVEEQKVDRLEQYEMKISI